MKVHALARHDYLMEHIEAIHRHLPEQLRGETLTTWNPTLSHTKHWAPNDVVMVAGYPDIAACGNRPVIYVEHGAGQSYQGIVNDSARYYHGGEHPANVAAYIGPRQDVIDAWGRPGFAAGSPICDPYELYAPERVAALSFHWNGAPPNMVGVPEAGTAYQHYAGQLNTIVSQLEDNGWEVLGHRHPKARHLSSVWRGLGVREVDVDEVRRRAQLLIMDNSSLMYEMMYCGRDVIALNCPEYRRDVEHGLRFWEWAPRVQADDPGELLDIISIYDETRNRASDLCDWDITSYVYGKEHSDGLDGQRAAAWITAFVSGL